MTSRERGEGMGPTDEQLQEAMGDLVSLRRDLHRHPELGLQLPWTQQRLLAELEPLGLETTLGKSSTSITAVIRGKRRGRSVLLRADMDALPVQEDPALEFASEEAGRMHACGHDLHMAALIGAARWLHARRDELEGDVVLMLQPGEEGYDGAGHMIAEGVLEAAGQRVEAAYGLHVISGPVPAGLIATKAGPIMSASDGLIVTVHGQGGHGSSPHRAADPVPVMAEMITAVQTFVTRHLDPFDPVIITVGKVEAGTQRNVIPDTAHFEATIRSYTPEAGRKVEAGLQTLLTNIATAHGVRAEVEYRHEYPPTVNDAEQAAFALQEAREVFGPERVVELDRPVPASEDFSRVLQEVPGAFLMVGAGVPGHTDINHSPRAMYDDAVLGDAARLLAELAFRKLNQG